MGWFQNNAPPQNNPLSPNMRQFLGPKAGPAPMPTQDAGGMGQATDQGNYSWTHWNPTPEDQAEGQRYLDDIRSGRGTDIFGNPRKPLPMQDVRYPGGSNNFDESRPDDPYWKARYRQNPNAPEWQKQPGYQTSEGPGGFTGQGPITADQLSRNPLNQPIPKGPVSSANPIVGGPAAPSTGFMGGSVPVSQIGPGGATVNSPNPIVGGAATGQAPSGATQDPLEWIKAYAQANNIRGGVDPNAEKDGTTRRIVDAMKAAGYNVDYEQPDEYGRSSGIILNGVWTKLWDGSGNWIVKPFAEAEPGSPLHQGGPRTGYGNMFGNSGLGGPFNPPSFDDLQNSPGYQFAFEQGLRGIQNSAAAKGTLLTGGTMKDIGDYLGGSLAGNAYDKYFSQSLQTHNTNFGDLFNMASLGKPA